MPEFTDRRSLLPLGAAIWLGLIVALGAAGFEQYFKSPLLEVGDVAVNALQVDNAKHLTELYGNYSRFEFNHPGPAFFYVYAAGEELFYNLLGVVPSPDNAHLLTSMFLQSAFFVLAISLMAAHLPGRLWYAAALLAGAIYFGPLETPFMSIWPPHVLLMPFLCFLAACSSLACGRIDHLPFVIISGGFLFHGHVAQPLFVGSLGALSCGLALYRTRDLSQSRREVARTHRTHLVIGATLAGLFLLPLLIDVLQSGARSNIATIFGRFYANTGDSKSPLQSFLYFSSFATRAQNQSEIFTRLGPDTWEFLHQHLGSIAFWAGVFALTPALALIKPTRVLKPERRFLLTAHLFVAAATVVCVLWGVAQAGPMVIFNGYFYYALFFFALVLALGWLDRLLRAQGNLVLFAALCVVALALFSQAFRLPSRTEEEAGMPVKRAVEMVLREAHPTATLLSFEHSSWPTVASVALDLQRRGITFYLTPWWGFMFGQQHSLSHLGAFPEDVASVWWITNPGEGGVPLSPSLSLFTNPAPLRPTGDEISFRGGANAFRYIVSGISPGNIENAHTELPRTVLLFSPVYSDRDVQLSLELESSLPGAKAQPVVVLFDGREIARLRAGQHATHPVIIPSALWNAKACAKLELRFPEAVAMHDYKRPRFPWWASCRIWKICVKPAP